MIKVKKNIFKKKKMQKTKKILTTYITKLCQW